MIVIIRNLYYNFVVMQNFSLTPEQQHMLRLEPR